MNNTEAFKEWWGRIGGPNLADNETETLARSAWVRAASVAPACFVPELATALDALDIQCGDARPDQVRAVAAHLRKMMTDGVIYRNAFDDLLANIAHDLDAYAQASEPSLAP